MVLFHNENNLALIRKPECNIKHLKKGSAISATDKIILRDLQ